MSTIEVSYKVTNQVVRDEMIKTGDARPAQRRLVVDLTQVDADLRKSLVEAAHDTGRGLFIALPDMGSGVTFELDHDPEPVELPSLIAKCNEMKEQHQAELRVKQKEQEERRKKFEADRKAIEDIRERDAEEAERRKAEAEREKREWIESYGSDHLKRASAAGYDSQRQYVIERAAKELPGFVVDFNDTSTWSSRSFPTEDALDIEANAKKAGFDAQIVWLKTPATADISDDQGYEDYDFEPCEAVVVRKYLGRYDAVQIIQ